jgi:hypothetical protein
MVLKIRAYAINVKLRFILILVDGKDSEDSFGRRGKCFTYLTKNSVATAAYTHMMPMNANETVTRRHKLKRSLLNCTQIPANMILAPFDKALAAKDTASDKELTLFALA